MQAIDLVHIQITRHRAQADDIPAPGGEQRGDSGTARVADQMNRLPRYAGGVLIDSLVHRHDDVFGETLAGPITDLAARVDGHGRELAGPSEVQHIRCRVRCGEFEPLRIDRGRVRRGLAARAPGKAVAFDIHRQWQVRAGDPVKSGEDKTLGRHLRHDQPAGLRNRLRLPGEFELIRRSRAPGQQQAEQPRQQAACAQHRARTPSALRLKRSD